VADDLRADTAVGGQARRFDASPTWFSALGAGLTVPWLASLDRAALKTHAVGLASRSRAELKLSQHDSTIASIPIVDAEDKLQRAGILCLRPRPSGARRLPPVTTPTTTWTACWTIWGLAGNPTMGGSGDDIAWCERDSGNCQQCQGPNIGRAKEEGVVAS
jgi:hypothetical protein